MPHMQTARFRSGRFRLALSIGSRDVRLVGLGMVQVRYDGIGHFDRHCGFVRQHRFYGPAVASADRDIPPTRPALR